MKIPTQKIQICVGIFLQHYTFLQKRTFSILCENFSRFVRKATAMLHDSRALSSSILFITNLSYKEETYNYTNYDLLIRYFIIILSYTTKIVYQKIILPPRDNSN